MGGGNIGDDFSEFKVGDKVRVAKSSIGTLYRGKKGEVENVVDVGALIYKVLFPDGQVHPFFEVELKKADEGGKEPFKRLPSLVFWSRSMR